MDFVSWCDQVLERLDEAVRSSSDRRSYGISLRELGEMLLEGGTAHLSEVHDALVNLEMLGLASSDKHAHYWKVSQFGREHVADALPLWQKICEIQLQDDQRELLHAVNQLSPQEYEDRAEVNWIGLDEILAVLGWSDKRLLDGVSRELHDQHLVGRRAFMGGITDYHATYIGLAWETRRGHTVEAAHIDQLVSEWETTSVDFKRELHTGTADEKAELTKDILGLVNTQASGRRWLIIGFDDKTRSYHGPPSNKITQNHLEQLLARYTEPVVLVRYEEVEYREGPVGRLELLREPSKLPYRAAKSIGDRKRIEHGQIFVRHGSQTEEPTPAELQALNEEAQRAKSPDGAD